MNIPRTAATVAVVAAFLAGPVAAQDHAVQPSKGFDQLRPLVGEWEGQMAGKPVRATYTLISGGTALMERTAAEGEPEMITVYTPDGDRVAVTHFCSSGNQPHMRTEPVTGSATEFSFSFMRATNLASPTAGHMHHLTVALQDRDHFTEAWTWSDNGKDHTEIFRFTRKS